MDDFIRIPGTNFRIGLDPIIGLIPGVGDGVGAAASTVILAAGLREGVPAVKLARMGVNIVINTILGAVPLAGDILSAWFKSNRRNHRILQQHLGTLPGGGESARPRRSSTPFDYGVVIAFFVVVLGLVMGAAWFSIWVLTELFQILFQPIKA